MDTNDPTKPVLLGDPNDPNDYTGPIGHDEEWDTTERSEAAEKALVREYHYHMLRAEELREFLRGCGITFTGFD